MCSRRGDRFRNGYRFLAVFAVSCFYLPCGAEGGPSRSSALSGQTETVESGPRIPADRIRWHVPDPVEYIEDAPRRIQEAEQEAADAAASGHRDQETEARRRVKKIRRVIELLNEIRKPNQVRLSLEDALQAAMAKNYAVRIASYNPAIKTAELVQAEAAFDALFFTNIQKNKVDRPTGSELLSTNLDFFQLDTGVSKLLPLGTQVRASYQIRRTQQAFAFQLINPEYFSSVLLEMRQPLLRGFGVDFNRTQIMVAQNDRKISQTQFRRQVRDTLLDVERAYWNLAQARRNYVVTARILPEYEQKLTTIRARGEHDTLAIHISTTEAAYHTFVATLIEEKTVLFNARDALVTLINRDDLNLVDQAEIIPTDFPPLTRVHVDQLAELQTALDHHPDIEEQKLRVATAKLIVGQAKNQELPKFDVTFRVTHDGLSGTADRSFDELSRRKFIEYFVGVDFEIPVGNRQRRAAHRTRELEYAQQVAVLQQVFDKVILDVNVAVRVLNAFYDELVPLYDSAEARETEVDARIARQETWQAEVLIDELNSYRQFNDIRQNLLDRILAYNQAILELEKAKGTVLPFDNVILEDVRGGEDGE